jgi:outer membrane protein assembly factor BamB
MTYGFTGIAPDTGKILWEFQPAFTFRSVGSPVHDDGIVFATVGGGGGGKDSVALDLRANPEKPVLLYRLDKDIPYVPTPVAHGGRIYLWQDSGILRCIEARTGKTVYEHRVGGNYFSSPVLVGDNLWGMSREGRVVVVKAGDTFELVAENDLGTGVHATPAIADGVMYIRTDTHLMSLGGR